MPPLVPLESPAQHIDRLACVDEEFLQPTLPSESLVIMRNLGNASQDLQTYLLLQLLLTYKYRKYSFNARKIYSK